VAFTRKKEVAKRLGPSPNVRPLGVRPWNLRDENVLSRVHQRDENLSSPHAHGLAVFHLVSLGAGLPRVVKPPGAGHEGLRPQLVKFAVPRSREPVRDANMEGQGKIHVRKLLLRVSPNVETRPGGNV